MCWHVSFNPAVRNMHVECGAGWNELPLAQWNWVTVWALSHAQYPTALCFVSDLFIKRKYLCGWQKEINTWPLLQKATVKGGRFISFALIEKYFSLCWQRSQICNARRRHAIETLPFLSFLFCFFETDCIQLYWRPTKSTPPYGGMPEEQFKASSRTVKLCTNTTPRYRHRRTKTIGCFHFVFLALFNYHSALRVLSAASV